MDVKRQILAAKREQLPEKKKENKRRWDEIKEREQAKKTSPQRTAGLWNQVSPSYRFQTFSISIQTANREVCIASNYSF